MSITLEEKIFETKRHSLDDGAVGELVVVAVESSIMLAFSEERGGSVALEMELMMGGEDLRAPSGGNFGRENPFPSVFPKESCNESENP